MKHFMGRLKNWVRDNWPWLQPLLLPKLSSKITIYVVLAGLGLVVSPVWEPFLVQAVFYLTGIKVDIPGSPWIGVMLVAFGLLYHFGIVYIESFTSRFNAASNAKTLEDARKHDCEIAIRFREAFIENDKDTIVRRLHNQDACLRSDINNLDTWYDFLVSVETIYIDPEVNSASKTLAESIAVLRDFIAYKFFDYPKRQQADNTQFVLQPSLNCDLEGNGSLEQQEKYSNLQVELQKHVSSFVSKYANLIELFHIRLKCH